MKRNIYSLILIIIYLTPSISHAFSLKDVGKVIEDGVKKVEKVIKPKKPGAREPDKDPPPSNDPIPGHKKPDKPKVN